MKIFYLILIFSFGYTNFPEKRIVAEWEPSYGTMIRWPLGLPINLVIELASDELLYVLVENEDQQTQANTAFINWGINPDHIIFIETSTYTHWTRDYGPKFLIGDDTWQVINQQFNGYPEENGCQEDCDNDMTFIDCNGNQFCNNQPGYSELGYDCYVNNESCEDFNLDGQIIDWLGDGYCDDGGYGLNFMCDEYSWDCGDCGTEINDLNGYCEDVRQSPRINFRQPRPINLQYRGWNDDDDTNIDFSNQLEWEILDLPLFWTGGNFMTDGYGMGFSTRLMINENNMEEGNFYNIMQEYLSIRDYHIFENPSEESIQHIDCFAKLVSPETVIIKQVSQSSPEYECIEEFANSFYELSTFYERPFNIHRIFCPEINGGDWELNPVAAYTNSYILNKKIFVPQYGIDDDINALSVYQEAMPGYEIIGFLSSEENPWYAEDAIHCRTIGIFNPAMMHIVHKSIRYEDLFNNDSISIEGRIIDYGNYEIESVKLFWKYDSENDSFQEVSLNINSENRFSGIFPSLSPNSEIQYYIQCNNNNGDTISHPNFGWHTFNSLSNSLSIKENNKTTPTAWALHQNYPNPFNPTTLIRYDLPQDAFVKITVFNMYGKVIKTIINEKKSSGSKFIQWDATNNQGKIVSSGVYLYRIEVENFMQTKKMIFIK